MTAGEFKAWLDGYVSAGGSDVSEIVKKAQSIDIPVYPSPFKMPDVLGPSGYNTGDYCKPFVTWCANEVSQ